MITFTSEELRQLADRIDNAAQYRNLKSYVILEIKKHPNGRSYAEFEQPCHYAECFSSCYKYNEK